jgi:hypothetical protein
MFEVQHVDKGLTDKLLLIWTTFEQVGCHLNNHPKSSKGDGTHNEFP